MIFTKSTECPDEFESVYRIVTPETKDEAHVLAAACSRTCEHKNMHIWLEAKASESPLGFSVRGRLYIYDYSTPTFGGSALFPLGFDSHASARECPLVEICAALDSTNSLVFEWRLAKDEPEPVNYEPRFGKWQEWHDATDLPYIQHI